MGGNKKKKGNASILGEEIRFRFGGGKSKEQQKKEEEKKGKKERSPQGKRGTKTANGTGLRAGFGGTSFRGEKNISKKPANTKKGLNRTHRQQRQKIKRGFQPKGTPRGGNTRPRGKGTRGGTKGRGVWMRGSEQFRSTLSAIFELFDMREVKERFFLCIRRE